MVKYAQRSGKNTNKLLKEVNIMKKTEDIFKNFATISTKSPEDLLVELRLIGDILQGKKKTLDKSIRSTIINAADTIEMLMMDRDFREKIAALPSCNTCDISEQCVMCPKTGTPTRFNCPHHKKDEKIKSPSKEMRDSVRKAFGIIPTSGRFA